MCRTNNHFTAGEKALFSVKQCGLKQDYSVQFVQKPANRTFYIQAEEELWNYAPGGMDQISGHNLSDKDQ